MSGTQDAPSSKLSQIISHIEETIIATLLGLMVLVTFANVVLRYGFGLSLLWGLEVTLILFAWLVLFGISYGFKITAHLGVDAILNMAGTRLRKAMVVFSALVCVAYGGLLMKGAWDYWAPFGGFQQTTGRIIPTGFDENTRDQGWYETDFKTGDKKNIAGERTDASDKPPAKAETGTPSGDKQSKVESKSAAPAKTDTSKAS